jgi:hypothetical protein
VPKKVVTPDRNDVPMFAQLLKYLTDLDAAFMRMLAVRRRRDEVRPR